MKRCIMNKQIQHINQSSIQLTSEEQHAYDYLAQSHPEWADQFKAVLLTARDLITQRLVVSIYRENLIQQGENADIILNEAVPFEINSPTGQTMVMHWPKSNKVLYAPISGFHAFNRIDMQGPFYLLDQSDDQHVQRVQHPVEILDLILTEANQYMGPASQQFHDDLMNSAANMALSLSFQALSLKDEGRSMLDIIDANIDSYLRSEQAVVEGHPLHPGAKLRKGLTPEMTIQYSSEFQHAIQLKMIAVHYSLVRTQSQEHTYNNTLFKMFPGLEKVFNSTFSINEQDQYSIIIVHPWQYEEILHRDYQDEIARNLIVDIDYEPDYYAGLSFRTLMPKYPVTTPHVKLSTNVHITGEIRTLSEQTTFNGPLVSRILQDIMENDDLFKNIHTSPVNEICGIHFYNREDQGEYQTERSEQIGSLLRENIYHLVENDTINLIPSSLVSFNPNQGDSVVNSLIERLQFAHQYADFQTAAKSWLTQYAQSLIDMVVPLLVKYGIALEAHLQNSIASFNQDGSLNHMYIRDFEGLRIDEAQLNQSGYSTENFHEKSRILTNKATSVFNKAFYSTIQNHLGEVILTIAKHPQNDQSIENALWLEVRDIILEKFKQMAKDQSIDQTRLAEMKAIFFSKTIDYKCVTTMRLEDEAHEYTYIKVDNPLHKA